MDDLIIQIKADTDKAVKEINNLTKSVDKLKKTEDGSWSKKTNKGFADVGKSANTLNKTLGSLAATWLTFQTGKSIITTAADIEEGFLGVAKTTGLVGEKFDTFKDKLLELSTTMGGVSVSELQKIAETAGQMGIKGTENILKFTETIAKVGATTELTAEQAARAFGKLSTTMGVPIEDIDRLASAANKLADGLNADVGEIVNMSQKMSGVAKEFGLSADEVLALSATLTQLGLQAELGGTAVSEIMLSMLKNVEGFAKASGVSFKEFSRMIKEDPVEALQTFFNSLSKLDTSTKLKVLDDLKLKGSGVVQTTLKMAESTDLLTKSLATSKKAWDENKSIQEEYAKMQEGFNAQMDKVKNTIEVLATKIGEALLPKLKELAEKFTEWVNSLSDDKIKMFSEDIAGLVDVLGSAAEAIGGFITSFAGFVTDYPTISKSILGLVLAFKGLNTVIPLVGISMMAMGGNTAKLTTATGTLAKGTDGLVKSLFNIIGVSTPVGLAVVAIGTAATLAFNSYIEGQEKAIEKNKEFTEILNKTAESAYKIGDGYIELNKQTQEHGGVAEESLNKVRTALQTEIAYLEKTLTAWQNNTESTKEQDAAMLKLSGRVGQLKAELDTLPAKYTLRVEAETTIAKKEITDTVKEAKGAKAEITVGADTKEAEDKYKKLVADAKNKEITAKYTADMKTVETKYKKLVKDVESKEIKTKVTADTKEATQKIKKISKPIDTDVKFDPDTRDADRARKNVSKKIIVPVYYRVMNQKPAGTSTSRSSSSISTSGASTEGASAESTSLSTSYGTKLVVPTTQNDTKVDVYFNVDGAKIKAVMEKNTISNLEDYLLRETGF